MANLFTDQESTTTVLDVVDAFQADPSLVQAPSNANRGMSGMVNGLKQFNVGQQTADLIILGIFVFGGLVYAFTRGRDWIVAVLVSAYLSLAITTNIPLPSLVSTWVSRTGFVYVDLLVFVVIFIILFFFLSRSRLLQQVSSYSGTWWQVVIFSFLQMGLLMSIIFSFLPSDTLERFSDLTRVIFVSDVGRFGWIVLPIVALIFFGGRRRRRRRGRISSLDDLDY